MVQSFLNAQLRVSTFVPPGGHNDSSGNLTCFLQNLKASEVVEVKTMSEAAPGTVTSYGNAQIALIKKQ
jgi:hypothetical protein